MPDHLSTPMVATYAPDGVSDKQWLGALHGVHVAGPAYDYVLPGGANQMSCVLSVPPEWRHPAVNVGRICRVHLGPSYIWSGKLLEPQPGTGGMTVTAQGSGTFGNLFRSFWTGTFNPNNALATAVADGLPWVCPTFSTSGLWLNQPQDSGSQNISEMLNLVTSGGGFTWLVGARDTLTLFPLPATGPGTEQLVLLSSDPQGRTLGADVNRLWGRYQISADNTDTSTPASFGLVSASTPQSIALHGAQEDYMDLSGAGVLSSATAGAAVAAVLSKYQRASWTGPFTVRYGQLLTPGGYPVDLALNHVGKIVKLAISDMAYGGEVGPGAIRFVIGQYAYDAVAKTATVTPALAATSDLAGMMSAITAALTPASS